MTVKELIKILKGLNPNYEIDMASDEEGNSFGDIDNMFTKGKRQDKKISYSLYPINQECYENRY